MTPAGGCDHLHWLPVAAFLIMPLTLVITYVMAVAWEHVEPAFPYVSDTGTFPPESCVFAQLINAMALLLLVILYIRYRQIEEFIHLRPGRVPAWVNSLSAVIGIIGLLGLDILGNFQQSNVFVVHVIGAIANFSAGTVYFCMQTWLTKKMLPEIGTPLLVHLRMVLCSLCVFFTTVTIGSASISVQLFKGKDPTKWGPEDGGYGWHLTSTITEWLLILTYSVFALAFFKEFRFVVIHPPAITLTNVSPLKPVSDLGQVLKNL